MKLVELLKWTKEQGATDLHLSVGAPPTMRVACTLTPLGDLPLRPQDMQELLGQALDEEKMAVLKRAGDVDVSYSYPEVGRFRLNVFQQRGTIGMAIRVINTVVPQIHSLGLPDIISRLVLRRKGLILVTGPTNSGKSTTLAAIVNLINEELPCHVITLENPIEYLHKHKKSIINQREVGLDCESYFLGLRSALRQDPDVIMIGELNEPQSVSLALTAAELGRLVLSSLHTPDAARAIERIIDLFPREQKEQAQVQLASNLSGVVSQRLLTRKDGQGKVAAVEFMVTSPVVSTLISRGRIDQLGSLMKSGARSGMRGLDKHIQQLLEKGAIGEEEALENALDRGAMSSFISNYSASRSSQSLPPLPDLLEE